MVGIKLSSRGEENYENRYFSGGDSWFFVFFFILYFVVYICVCFIFFFLKGW